jgi:hypothetical protein
MTADLAIVATVAPSVRSVAEERAERIRGHLAQSLTSAGLALSELAAARAAGDDVTLGFPHWHEYVAWLVGDLRNLRLHNSDAAKAERLALAASMKASGMTYRPIAEKLGVSLGSVRNDLGTPRPKVAAVAPLPAPTGKVWEQAAEWLAREGDRGLTLLELAAKANWSEGKASGALSYLWARYAADKTDQIRDRQTAYVLTDVGYVTKRWPPTFA